MFPSHQLWDTDTISQLVLPYQNPYPSLWTMFLSHQLWDTDTISQLVLPLPKPIPISLNYVPLSPALRYRHNKSISAYLTKTHTHLSELCSLSHQLWDTDTISQLVLPYQNPYPSLWTMFPSHQLWDTDTISQLVLPYQNPYPSLWTMFPLSPALRYRHNKSISATLPKPIPISLNYVPPLPSSEIQTQ